MESSSQQSIEELKRRHQLELENEQSKWKHHFQTREGELKYKVDSESLQRKALQQLEDEKRVLERDIQELRTKIAQASYFPRS